MMDNLADAVRAVRERIALHSADLTMNEVRTRASLVDPLLPTLGWDAADPAQVVHDYATAEGPVQYALCDRSGYPVALIEATGLGGALESRRRQAVRSLAETGARYLALTDGNRWEVCAMPDHGGAVASSIASFSVADDSPRECAALLMLLSRVNLRAASATESEPAGFRDEPPSAYSQGLVRELREPVAAWDAPNRPLSSPPVEEPSEWVSLPSYDPEPFTPPPTAIMFPDERVYAIKRWRDLVLQTASWLWETGYLTYANVPVPAKGIRHIVNIVPQHQDDRPFTSPKIVPNSPLIIEGNMSADTSRKNVELLLSYCGVDPEDVYVGI